VQLLSAHKGPGGLEPSLAGGTDFAYGGAESGKTIVHSLEPIDLPAQLAEFATTTSPASGALYTLWIGANDLFDILADTSLSPKQVSDAVGSVIDNEAVFVGGIRLLGADELLVVNVPDLGKTPSVIAEGSTAIKAATDISKSYNARLATRMAALAKKYGMAISVVDVFTLIDEAIAAPAKYHFSNVTAPCWTGNDYGSGGTLCGATEARQNRYLFFDDVHPTARAYGYVAELAEKNLPASRAQAAFSGARD
jgi:phospholipase/lecithinase/hemolysin